MAPNDPPLQRDIQGTSGESTDEEAGSATNTSETAKAHKPAWSTTPEAVFKRSVDRQATIDPRIKRAVRNAGGVPKPYDPVLLRDISQHGVVQAYIDTLAQDAAAAGWQLVPRDEDTEVSESERIEAKRTLEDAHPEKSFRDILEQTTRNLLELGDAAWVKHYYTSGDIAEIIPVDSGHYYKEVDDHGLTKRYLYARRENATTGKPMETDEVVWFEWSSRTDHVYGYGPVEKGMNVIELLEELSDKERKDLIEGMPPGIISAHNDADNPVDLDEFENVREEFQMSEGERHRLLVSRGQWDYTDFSGNYQELQVLDRNKFWIHVLGAVFKCNAPYAGFDFQEGNHAQNEAQADAYAQRGFRQTLRRLEEAITRQLVHPDISEDLDFRFEREQTAEERKQNAELLNKTAEAARKWAKLGQPVSVDSDGTINVEPGEVDEEDAEGVDFEGGGGGGGGGPPLPSGDEGDEEGADGDDVAMSVDDPAAIKESLEASLTALEDNGLDATVKTEGGADELLATVIDAGAVMKDADAPDDVRDRVGTLLHEHMAGDSDLSAALDEADDVWPGVPRESLERVVRTEAENVLSTAKNLTEVAT